MNFGDNDHNITESPSEESLVRSSTTGKHAKISYKPIVLVILLAIFILQVLYTVNRRRGNLEQPIVPTVSVDITALPHGAEIFLDGKRVGASSVHQELVPGRHEIEVLLAGHRSWKESLTLTQPQAIRVALEPILMDLRIQTGQRKAQIWFDEERRESLADETIIRGISPGMHTIRIKASSEEARTSFELRPGSLPVPILSEAGPTILFVGGFLGNVRSECNCTAQLHMNGASQSLEPGTGAEFALPEGEYSGELHGLGSTGKPFTFEMGAMPTATVAVFWPAAKSAPKRQPQDTPSLVSTALMQIGNSKCDSAEVTVAQILSVEPGNADAIALQRRIARLRSVGGCQ